MLGLLGVFLLMLFAVMSMTGVIAVIVNGIVLLVQLGTGLHYEAACAITGLFLLLGMLAAWRLIAFSEFRGQRSSG